MPDPTSSHWEQLAGIWDFFTPTWTKSFSETGIHTWLWNRGPPREKIISRTSVLVGSLPPSSAALKEAFWFEDALTATFTVAPLLQSSRSDRKTQWMGSKRTSKTMRWRCIFTGVKCHTLHTSKKSDVRGNVFLRTNPYSCFFGLSWFTLNRSNECLDSLYHLMMILSWSINRFAGSIVGMFSNCANEK